jgi:hypothetical protein
MEDLEESLLSEDITSKDRSAATKKLKKLTERKDKYDDRYR